jgi:hypothetical protein
METNRPSFDLGWTEQFRNYEVGCYHEGEEWLAIFRWQQPNELTLPYRSTVRGSQSVIHRAYLLKMNVELITR